MKAFALLDSSHRRPRHIEFASGTTTTAIPWGESYGEVDGDIRRFVLFGTRLQHKVLEEIAGQPTEVSIFRSLLVAVCTFASLVCPAMCSGSCALTEHEALTAVCCCEHDGHPDSPEELPQEPVSCECTDCFCEGAVLASAIEVPPAETVTSRLFESLRVTSTASSSARSTCFEAERVTLVAQAVRLQR